jgi:hypothetical protein
MSVRLYQGPAYGSRSGEYLRGSNGELAPLSGEPILPIAWFADEPINDIAKVVRKWLRRSNGLAQRARLDGISIGVGLTDLPGNDFRALIERQDQEIAGVSYVSLDIGDDVLVRVLGAAPADATVVADDIVAIASQHLPHGLVVADVELRTRTSSDRLVTLDARLSPRSRLSLSQVARAAEGLQAVLVATDLDAASAWPLVAGGRADLLVGQRESQWLEVKRDAYRLREPAACIEAAQDVARLANGGSAALLICGMKASAYRTVANGSLV